MALFAKHSENLFGVGDRVKVYQKVADKDKTRSQVFEGIVLGIKGKDVNKTFIVRRLGVNQIGIERIYPLFSPMIEKIEVVKKGVEGVKRAKLFYIRSKSKREIEKIYSRSVVKNMVSDKPKSKKKKVLKKVK